MPKYPEQHKVTLSGNTAGALALVQSGTMSMAGGNNITLSQAGNAVTLSGANQVAGIAASNTTYTSGTVQLTGVGGGITVSSNAGQRVDLSVAAQSLQTEGVLSVGVSTGGNTAGNTQVSTGARFVLVASGNATASQATAATASTVTISVGTQTVQTQDVLSVGVSTGGNTAGNTTVNTGSRLVLVGSNGITASQGTAAGATTITLSGVTQSVQTQDVLSMGVSTGGNTAGNTTVNTGSRFVIVASGDLTASQATAAGASTITLSAGTQTVQTQDVLSIGVSTGGNTAGNTTVNTGSRFVPVGTNMISLSQATAAGATTVTFDATNQNLSVGVSTGGNTSGDTTVNSGSRLVLAGGNNITVSQGTAAGATTVTISAANAGGVGSLSMWPDQALGSISTSAFGSFTSAATRTTYSAVVFPMAFPAPVSGNYIRYPASITMTSATTNSHWGYTQGISLGIYSLNVNTLSLVSSFSNDFRLQYSSAANSTNASATFTMSYGSGAALSSSTSNSTNNAGQANFPWAWNTGLKFFPLGSGASSISAGQYFGAMAWSSSTSGANLGSLSGFAVQSWASAIIRDMGRDTQTVSANFPLQGLATITQTNTAMPGSIATADVSVSPGNSSLVNRNAYIQIFSHFV